MNKDLIQKEKVKEITDKAKTPCLVGIRAFSKDVQQYTCEPFNGKNCECYRNYHAALTAAGVNPISELPSTEEAPLQEVSHKLNKIIQEIEHEKVRSTKPESRRGGDYRIGLEKAREIILDYLPNNQVEEVRDKEESMIDYILDIDWLTTTEFCNKFNIPAPYYTGEIKTSVEKLLEIDAIKHRMFVEKAKELRRKPASNETPVKEVPAFKQKCNDFEIGSGNSDSNCFTNGSIDESLKYCIANPTVCNNCLYAIPSTPEQPEENMEGKIIKEKLSDLISNSLKGITHKGENDSLELMAYKAAIIRFYLWADSLPTKPTEKEWKKEFEYWLTNNLYINKSTADIIVSHVEKYIAHPQK